MKLIKNLPILIKSLISPILATVLFATVAAVFVGTYLDVRAKTEQQAEISALRVDIQGALLGLSTAHLETLRASNWKHTQVQDDLIDKSIAKARASLDGVQSILERRVADTEALEHAAVGELLEQFTAYRSAAEETLNAIGIDIFMATMFLNDTDVRQNETKAAAQTLLDRVVAFDSEIASAVDGSLAFALVAVLAAAALAAVLSVGTGLVFGQAIARPIRELTDMMRELADGNTDLEVPGTKLEDEVGQMAQTVQVFRDNMIRTDELSRQTAREQEERAARAERLDTMTSDFDAKVRAALDVLTTAAGDMNRTSANLTEAASATNSQVTSISQTARDVSGSVQTVASAAEELGASIGEISEQVQRQSTMAKSASEAANGSRQHVHELAQQADRIGEVVNLIQDIAEQTNLLALNATIEAARAGDAGKGFAVVATEVKNLATQTAQATESISNQIQAVQSQTQSTVQAIESIVKSIMEMTEISSVVAAAVEEQNAAAQEISRGANEAAQGTENVTSGIAEVTDAADSTGSASGEVSHAAGTLSKNSATLKGLVDDFLSGVRAA